MDIEEALKKLNKFNEYENAVVLSEDTLYEIQKAIETILKELEKKDKIINKISEDVKENLAFEKRLKKENIEPDSFNQGKFYISDNINNILKGK